jgi:hypothetical protein
VGTAVQPGAAVEPQVGTDVMAGRAGARAPIVAGLERELARLGTVPNECVGVVAELQDRDRRWAAAAARAKHVLAERMVAARRMRRGTF